MSKVKDLKKQFEKGTSPKQLVEKTLQGSQSGSYLYGGKTTEAQQVSTPLVVLAKPGAYNMVCNEEACYIRIPHGQQVPTSPSLSKKSPPTKPKSPLFKSKGYR